MYNWNRYGIHPDVTVSMDDEIFLVRRFLENLRKRFPKLEIIYMFGNHEARYEKWVIEKARPLHNRLRLESEYGLENLNIEFYPYGFKYQVDNTNLFLMHSPPSYGVNGARTSLLRKNDESYLFGCTHREQNAHITAGSGKRYMCYFNGWGGSVNETPNHAKVFSYRKGHFGWQKCFSIVTVIDGDKFNLNQYSVVDHRVVVDGIVYDYSKEPIKDDLNYES